MNEKNFKWISKSFPNDSFFLQHFEWFFNTEGGFGICDRTLRMLRRRMIMRVLDCCVRKLMSNKTTLTKMDDWTPLHNFPWWWCTKMITNQKHCCRSKITSHQIRKKTFVAMSENSIVINCERFEVSKLKMTLSIKYRER